MPFGLSSKMGVTLISSLETKLNETGQKTEETLKSRGGCSFSEIIKFHITTHVHLLLAHILVF